MSVLRNLNVLSQMRLDVPHIRLLESGVAGDFDTVVGRILSGGKPLVVRGFTVSGGSGSPASALQLIVADGVATNLNASASGSFLWIPSDRPNEILNGATNGNVVGSFVAGTVNYVGIDFVRQPDSTTVDLVRFKNPSTGAEQTRLVPLAKTLDYKIVITTVPFSSQANIVPVARVTVNSTGTVSAIVDSRRLMFRLGSGGDLPNSLSTFNWPNGRTEAAFSGADKSITNQKDWMDAVMARLWEVGGGANWFSPASDRNVWSVNTDTRFSNGDYFELPGGGVVNWKGVRFYFDNSGGSVYYNNVSAGTGSISAGDCIYVDLDRTSNATIAAKIGPISSIGMGPKPGSRWVMAWYDGTNLYTRNWRYPVGTIFTPATDLAQGVVKIHRSGALTGRSVNDPVVASLESFGGLFLAVTGINNAVSATSVGGHAVHGVSGDVGVYGQSTGPEAGVFGISVNGVGVSGESTNEVGVSGTSDSGDGVSGYSTSGVGVRGSSSTSAGVVGVGAGTHAGVRGEASSTALAVGVHGTTAGAGIGQVGVKGEAAGTSSQGVLGVTTGANGYGVTGTANGSGGVGVAGQGAVIGVKGLNTTSGTGVDGESTNFVGVKGTGGTYGVEGTGSTPTANGGRFQGGDNPSGNAAVGASFAGGVGSNFGGDGISSTGGTGASGKGGRGGTFTGGTSGGEGVRGTGTGTADGVRGIASTSGRGVYGTSSSGAGVSGLSTSGSGVEGSSTSGYGLKSTLGDVGAPNTNKFVFTSNKLGAMWIPAQDFTVLTGTASSWDYSTGGTAVDVRLKMGLATAVAATIRVPRGATIEDVKIHFHNDDSATYSGIGVRLSKSVYSVSGVGHTTSDVISSTTGTIPANSNSWITLTPITIANAQATNGSSAVDDCSVFVLRLSFDAPALGKYIYLSAARIQYSYSTVDFGV